MESLRDVLESIANWPLDMFTNRPVLTPEEEERQKAKLEKLEKALISLDFREDEIIDEYRKNFTEAKDALREAIADRKKEINNGTNNTPDDTKIESAVKNFFSVIKHGTATRKLAKIRTNKKDISKIDISGTLQIKSDSFMVEVKNFMKVAGIRTSTQQLFDALKLTLVSKNIPNASIPVKLPLAEYMTMRGLKDEKTARKQINEDLLTLSNITISFTQQLEHNKQKDYMNIKLIGSSAIKRGFITVFIDPVFFEILSNYPILQYPKQALELNSNNNPNSYNLLLKIADHRNLNVDKSNKFRLKVRTLLKECTYIPSYEEVAKTDRHFKRRIIEPLERDLNACDKTFTWEYCHKNGAPLTEEEIDSIEHDDNIKIYDIWIELEVNFYWREYPDETARLERIAEKIQEQEASKKKKAKSKPKTPIALP